MTGNTQCAAILPLGTNSREAATYAQEDTHQQHLIAKCGNNQRFRWHTMSTYDIPRNAIHEGITATHVCLDTLHT